MLTLADITAKIDIGDDSDLGNTAFQSTMQHREHHPAAALWISQLGTPLRLEYVASGTTNTVVTPGVVQYTTDQVQTGATTLNTAALSLYSRPAMRWTER